MDADKLEYWHLILFLWCMLLSAMFLPYLPESGMTGLPNSVHWSRWDNSPLSVYVHIYIQIYVRLSVYVYAYVYVFLTHLILSIHDELTSFMFPYWIKRIRRGSMIQDDPVYMTSHGVCKTTDSDMPPQIQINQFQLGNVNIFNFHLGPNQIYVFDRLFLHTLTF